MKILIIGSNGFIGKNLACSLENHGYNDLIKFDVKENKSILDEYTKNCDFVFYLTELCSLTKTSIEKEYEIALDVIKFLKKNNNKCPVLVTSSIQAEANVSYCESIKSVEKLFLDYAKEYNTDVYIYRLTEVFGKWCDPKDNLVASICNNIARGLPTGISEQDIEISLVYIDDVVKEFISCIDSGFNKKKGILKIPVCYNKKLENIVGLIKSFKQYRNDLGVPDTFNDFERNLYSTYLSYFPKNSFSYSLNMNTTEKGSFTEFANTLNCGQFCVNTLKPGVLSDSVWHDSKVEKFLVVNGQAKIRLKNVYDDEVIEYKVSSKKLEVVEVPPGYIYSVENIGTDNLVVVVWINETLSK